MTDFDEIRYVLSLGVNPSPALGSFDLELRRGVRADPPSISHESAVNLYFLIVGCNYLVSLIILSFVSRF